MPCDSAHALARSLASCSGSTLRLDGDAGVAFCRLEGRAADALAFFFSSSALAHALTRSNSSCLRFFLASMIVNDGCTMGAHKHRTKERQKKTVLMPGTASVEPNRRQTGRSRSTDARFNRVFTWIHKIVCCCALFLRRLAKNSSPTATPYLLISVLDRFSFQWYPKSSVP